MAKQSHLELDRSLANLDFDSWVLADHKIIVHKIDIPTPAPAVVSTNSDTDYVHSYNTAYHNGIINQPSGTFCFLSSTAIPSYIDLYQLNKAPSYHQGSFHKLFSIPQWQNHKESLEESPLNPTVVEILSSTPSTPSNHPSFLVSTGQGDLHLLHNNGAENNTGDTRHPPVCPLRSPSPLNGILPFQLLAAMKIKESNTILAIIWAVKSPTAHDNASSTQNKDASLSACQIYALHLSIKEVFHQEAAGNDTTLALHAPLLSVDGVSPLAASPRPPYGCVCNAAEKTVAISLDPTLYEDGNDHAMAAAACTKNNDHDGGGDDDDDDISPTTLHAAIARVGHLTSDELMDSNLPRSQYADVFKETGPDGIGALGTEPSCAIFLYSFVPGNDGVPRLHAVDEMERDCNRGNGHAWGWKAKLEETIFCAPHRYLGCQGDGNQLTLGLTDDVDCAVISIEKKERKESKHGFSIQHTGYIPALAYIAAGKLQRKFFLPSLLKSSTISCTLIEAQNYCYLYERMEDVMQKNGKQEILELTSDPHATVVGAALISIKHGDEQHDDEANRKQDSNALVILENNRIRWCYQ